VKQPLIIKPGITSSPTDLESLRRCIAFKMSNSEMEGNCKNLYIIKKNNQLDATIGSLIIFQC